MSERPRRSRRFRLLGLVAAVLVAGGVGLAALRDDGSVSSADCAFLVEWDGRRWLDYFGTDRTPVAGEVLGDGVVPGCDDTGQGPGPSEDVGVRSIRGVDEHEAVLVLGRVLIPEGATGLPEQLRDGNAAVRCELEGSFRLTGEWTGVTSREVRFDGDVRPPYRVEFRTRDGWVTDDWAEVGLEARGTSDSRRLSPDEVKAMLWQDGEEVLAAHCEDDRFVVDSIDPVAAAKLALPERCNTREAPKSLGP